MQQAVVESTSIELKRSLAEQVALAQNLGALSVTVAEVRSYVAACSSPPTAASAAASEPATGVPCEENPDDVDAHDDELRVALALSRRLADEHRARVASAVTAQAPVAPPASLALDADAMRQARLRRFGGGS